MDVEESVAIAHISGAPIPGHESEDAPGIARSPYWPWTSWEFPETSLPCFAPGPANHAVKLARIEVGRDLIVPLLFLALKQPGAEPGPLSPWKTLNLHLDRFNDTHTHSLAFGGPRDN